jgi:acyl-[acyl-carrier-protein]-phospholipid O-acyltransferase/long-chain-fatty-acid--[acyl-carrier-protein] ligase
MSINQFSLFSTRRFLPLFVTQFLGAFNDNVYKNALVILITYKLAKEFNLNAEILITVAAGIFILPFFLFSAIAGQLADKFEKSMLIRYTKAVEVILILVSCIGFYLHSIYLLMSVLFLLGTQATFFGPVKYSILPEHLKTNNELIAGNALIEAGTFLAILLGTILGGLLIILNEGPLWVCIATLIVAVAGLIISFEIPKAAASEVSLSLNWNLFSETWRIIRYSAQQNKVFVAIIGISWFWLMGATYLSQFPTYVKNILQADAPVVTLFLTLFSVGVGLGSLLCNKLLKGKIHARYVYLAGLGMTLFGVDLVLASYYGANTPAKLISLTEFLKSLQHWRIMIDLLLISICGGIYIVPLYVIMQQKTMPAHRSRVIASNNILNALFMVLAAVVISLLLAQHFTISQVFLIAAILNFFMAFYMRIIAK